MNRQLSLFAPVGAAEPTEEVKKLGERLPDRIYLGTSSWSFPGWKGIVYDKDVSKTTLARHGLAAYAQHPILNAVGIDRTYYGPITADEFRAYGESVPEHFRFVVKAHELLTWQSLKDARGEANPRFLDPTYALDEVVGPMREGLGEKAAVLLLQFPPQRIDSVPVFLERLQRFLEALPRDVAYACELRNPELLTEDYAKLLVETEASHCFNVHPTMPAIEEQARTVDPAASPTRVVRWMLRRTRTYGEAKDAFFPFDRIADEDPGSRTAIADLLAGAKRAFVIVNNKAEGSAPLSLVGLAKELVTT